MFSIVIISIISVCKHGEDVINTIRYVYTRVVHKLLRQSKLKGTWKSYKLDITWLDTSTLFLSTWKYQAYSYTRLIAESLRRTSPGGMRSTPTWKTLRQKVTMSLMRFWKRHSFSMYTSCNQIHFMWHWTHLSYTYVQLISYVQNITQSSSNFPWLWYVFQQCLSLVGLRKPLNTVCAIHIY